MNAPTYLSLTHYPEQGIVYCQMLRTVNSEEYKQALLAVCALIRKSDARHWLVDLSKTTSPNIRDQNWATRLIGRNLQRTNIKKIAFVLSNDLFLEVVLEKANTKLRKLTNNEILIARFFSIEYAKQWLDSQADLEGLFRYDAALSA